MTTRLIRSGAALCALLVLALAVPIALARWGHWPIRGLPTWDQVSDFPAAIVSDTAVFGALTLLAWAVWALFMASVVLEVAANASGRDAPRIPFAGVLQRDARQLVAALLMTASVVGPLARAASSHPLPSTAVAPPEPSPATVEAPPPPEPLPAAAPLPAGGPQIEVRRGDSPWELAERHLGDPMRWREMWELNRGRPQPDGRAWMAADLIEPGWQLVLPADAQNVATGSPGSSHTVVPGDTLSGIAEQHLGEADRAMEIYDLNDQLPQPDGDALTDPDLIRPGWQLVLPADVAVTGPGAVPDAPAPAPADSPPATAPPATPPPAPTTTEPPPTTGAAPDGDRVHPTEPGLESAESDAGDGDLTTVGLVGGGIGAAGLLYLLERRRRAQQRRRTRGGPPPIAPADLQEAERLLRAGARTAPPSAVDAALRAAAKGVDHLPDIAHIEVREDQVEIVLQHAAPAPPGFINEGAARWRAAAAPAELEELAADAASPLPAVCPIATTAAGAEILIDLEGAPVTTIVGDQEVATDVLASIAAAVATSPWTGHPRVLTVGIDRAANLGTEIEIAETLSDALAVCMERAAAAEAALDEVQLTSTNDARAAGTTPDAWDPVVVVSADPPDDGERELLATLAPHRAVAVCTMSSVSLGRALTLDASGALQLDSVDAPLAANRLQRAESAGVARLLDHAASDPPSPAPDDFPAPARLPASQLRLALDDGPAPEQTEDVDVLVRVLGEIDAVRLVPGGEERLKVPKQRALEAITYLALREASVDREDVQAALWPDGANSAKTFSNAMWEARRALGTDAHGAALLPDASEGRYSLSERVVTDYGLFCELAARADAVDDAEEAASVLTEALRLVRGEPFVGVGRSYAWVGPHRGMIVAQILDAAEELAEVRLATGDWRAAERAARQGLRAMPCDERMYRVLMRAAHLAGNTAAVHRAFKELCDAVADPDTGAEPDDTVHPDTVALLEELTSSPTRRVTA